MRKRDEILILFIFVFVVEMCALTIVMSEMYEIPIL